jgi:membrane-associated phospholipid phosphatase
MCNMNLLQYIIHLDFYLFELINGQWTNMIFDHFFTLIRQPMLWAPLYLFLLLFVTINFRLRGWWWSFLFVITVSATDLVSSRLIKGSIGRIRPCMDPFLANQVRFLATYCPHSGSFTSSHAANHFGMAAFVAGTLGRQTRYWRFLYLWAFLISYAQVYVGVHFPLDVLGGALVGLLAGTLSARFFNGKIGPLLFTNPQPA